MKDRLLIATRNPGKIGEFREFLSDLKNCHSEFISESRFPIKSGMKEEMLNQVQHDKLDDDRIEIVSLSDLNITEEVEENGKTYKENSQKKALFYTKLSGLPTIADDGGIEISALNGQPGIHSNRWLGKKATDEELMQNMIKVSKELPENNRIAYFRTVVSLALPDGKVWSVTGEVKGIIAKKPHWKLLKGYPYRSFFFLPEIKKYYHENDLTQEEQKLYNHRYKAIQKLKNIIKEYLIAGTLK